MGGARRTKAKVPAAAPPDPPDPEGWEPDDLVVYQLGALGEAARQAVQKARETKRPVILAEGGEALAAIVDLDELQRLYDLLDERADQLVVREFQVAEARGEVEWLTMEEMERFQQQLLDEVAERARRKKAVASAPPSR